MKTILVVDDEKMILRLASEALEEHEEGYQVITASHGKEACELLEAQRVDLVLTDLKMPVMDGYELLSYMSKHHRDIPIVVMTGFGSPEIAKRLRQKGVLYYIEKPFEINMLREKISRAFADKSKGYIHGFTLANFLQAVEMEQKSITLRISAGEQIGYIYLENGDLIHAETDAHAGEDAAIEILSWDDPEIEIRSPVEKKKTIGSSLMQLLLEASKHKDEQSAILRSDEEGVLREAIRLSEAHHFKEAQALLVPFLKQYPRNHRAWLWYSRIIVTLKSIEASLKNAAKLAPRDPDVIEDVKKFTIIKERLDPREPLRRCPFCWTPLASRWLQCRYCRAHLFVSERFFSASHDANRQVLEEAIERYTRVISRERNLNAHYYLSMAHLNLEHWEEALNLFHKTVNLSPGQNIYSHQLRILINRLAMERTTVAFEERLSQQPNKPPPEPGPDEETDQRKKIMVVEDSATTRRVIAISLGQNGYEIIEASDGLEALSLLNEEQPDLILLDIVLPKMDGFKILSIIKSNELFKDIPVVMLTSKDSFMSRLKGKLSGSTAYLTKPFDPKKLLQVVKKYAG